MRNNVPIQYQGADAIIPITADIVVDNKPRRDISSAKIINWENPKNKNKNIENEKSVKYASNTQSITVLPNRDSNDTGEISQSTSDSVILNNDDNNYDKNTNEENLYKKMMI